MTRLLDNIRCSRLPHHLCVPRGLRLPLLAACLALALSACAPSNVPAPTASLNTLRVGDQKGGSQALLEAAGELDDLPYRLEFSRFAAAAPLLEALNADAIDLGGAGDAPVLFAQAAGTPLRVVQASRGDPANTAIVVPGDSPLHSAADLRGKTIATGKGSIGHYEVIGALKQAGIPVESAHRRHVLRSGRHRPLGKCGTRLRSDVQ